MNKIIPLGLGLLCAGLAAAAIWQASRLRETRHDLKKLKDRIGRLEAGQKEAPTREEVAKVEEKIVFVERKIDEIPASAPLPAAKTPNARLTEDRIQDLIDARIEEKIEARGGAGDDRKMPLETLAEKLTLDPITRGRVAEVANAAKKEIFNLLLEPRPDGTSLADEIVEGYLNGDADSIRKGFLKIFSEKIPGTDATYLEGIAEVQQRGREDLARVMSPEAHERYLGMNLHPENILTGYDPWKDYAGKKMESGR